MGQDSQLELISQPQDYFRELVTQALEQMSVQMQPETEFYLVNLLNHFMSTENLFSRDAEGQLSAHPLALLVKDAMDEAAEHNQMLLYRQVGDVSLYTAGYFGESLSRKAVGMNYYIDMGGVAYHQVASRASERHLRKMYGELADKFPSCVEVLARVSDTTASHSEGDLLRIYDQWRQTGSKRAEKSLKKAGILGEDPDSEES